jgi:hypothetical protein
MTLTLPLVCLRDLAVLPAVSVQLSAGRAVTKNAAKAVGVGGRIVCAFQRQGAQTDPSFDDLHPIAMSAVVEIIQPLADAVWKVVIRGEHRVRLQRMDRRADELTAHVEPIVEPAFDPSSRAAMSEFRSVCQSTWARSARLGTALVDLGKRPEPRPPSVDLDAVDSAEQMYRACQFLPFAAKLAVLQELDRPVQLRTATEAMRASAPSDSEVVDLWLSDRRALLGKLSQQANALRQVLDDEQQRSLLGRAESLLGQVIEDWGE